MGLPGHRRTSSHKRRRAAHFALRKTVLGACPKCASPIAPHRACKNCGFYNGRSVLDTGRIAKKVLKKSQLKAATKAPKEHKEHDHDHDHKEESPKS
jgi:large subunit ribosomal protein L32